jgi:5'-3' exonuclease
MNQEEFMNFCIMCKVDYNTNIPKIGIMSALKIIKKYRSVLKWKEAEPHVDISCLKLERCLEIFTTYGNIVIGENFKEIYKIHYWREPDFKGIREYLKEKNIVYTGNYERYWP